MTESLIERLRAFRGRQFAKGDLGPDLACVDEAATTLERVEKARAWETQEADLWSKRAHAAEAQVEAMRKALREAEVGLEFAGADIPSGCDFVPTPALALRAVRAALASSTPESAVYPAWRPIETAPRGQSSAMLISDGRQVLIGGRAWICTGEQHPTNFWHTQAGSGWNPAFTFRPTHWMPLPAPAEARSEQAEGEG